MSATTDAPTAPTFPLDLRLDEVPVGALRMVRAGEHRLCLVRTSDGIHALDHACPHEGYGLTQGKLDGELLTCAWHNWKFRVTDGECVLGEENVRTHRVHVDADGSLSVELSRPDPAAERARLTASLRSGIERNYIGQVARDVVRLLRADADPGDLVWEAIAFGAPRAEFGWGHSVAAAVDCLSMLHLYEGDERAHPVVQAISAAAESEHRYPVQPLPDPAPALGTSPGIAIRSMIEAEELVAAQALLRRALLDGTEPEVVYAWLQAAVSDHHLSYGHGSIYLEKAFELLDLLGWERADTVLPYLVPSIVYLTREDTLPYMRPFVKAMAALDLGRLAELPTDDDWSDDGRLLEGLLGRARTAPLTLAVEALQEGAGIEGLLDVVTTAVSERMLRYDTDNERDPLDDFGWLDLTHGITTSNAARWHHRRRPGPDSVRMVMWAVFLAHWTGRHEWHTHVGPRWEGRSFGIDGSERSLVAAGEALQRDSLTDHGGSYIVQAHCVKTARAAALEAVRLDSEAPLQATARFLEGPRTDRFVWGNVARSIEFVSGRTKRDA